MAVINTRLKLAMLAVIEVWLVFALTGGLLGIFFEATWTYDITIGTRQDNIKVGVLEACYRLDVSGSDGDWECKSFNDDGFDTDYEDMDIVLYCLVGCVAGVGACILLGIVAVIVRHMKAFKPILVVIIIIAFGAGACCGVSVAYIAEDDDLKVIVPKWITSSRIYLLDKTMGNGWTFYIICVACGCALFAGILTAILLFIVWDEEEYTANMEQIRHELDQSEEVKYNTMMNANARNPPKQYMNLTYDDDDRYYIHGPYEEERVSWQPEQQPAYRLENRPSQPYDPYRFDRMEESETGSYRRRPSYEINFDLHQMQRRHERDYEEEENRRRYNEQMRKKAILEMELAEEQRIRARQQDRLVQERLRLEREQEQLRRMQQGQRPHRAYEQQHNSLPPPRNPSPEANYEARRKRSQPDYPENGTRLHRVHAEPVRYGRDETDYGRDRALYALYKEDIRLSNAYEQYFNEPY